METQMIVFFAVLPNVVRQGYQESKLPTMTWLDTQPRLGFFKSVFFLVKINILVNLPYFKHEIHLVHILI